jgi:hypothetical protein
MWGLDLGRHQPIDHRLDYAVEQAIQVRIEPHR